MFLPTMRHWIWNLRKVVLTHNQTQDVQPDQHPGAGAVLPGDAWVLPAGGFPVLTQRLRGFHTVPKPPVHLHVPLHISTSTVHTELLHSTD